jgi:hypothetical protein
LNRAGEGLLRGSQDQGRRHLLCRVPTPHTYCCHATQGRARARVGNDGPIFFQSCSATRGKAAKRK